MITIAITIDPKQLRELDRLTRRARRGSSDQAPSRSRIVRQALAEYLARHAREEQEARDREIISRHRKRLARQAAALIGEQAEP